MKFRKLISVTAAAAALICSMAALTASAAETQTITEWTSDFNVSVAAESASEDIYQAKYGTTIFGKFQAAGKNDATAMNAGLNLRMTPSTGTDGISRVTAGANYLVKLGSSADDNDYALGVLGTEATLTSAEGISLSGGKTFEMSYDTYAATKSTGKTTTVTLKDSNGSELISYTYTGSSGNITDVKFGGTQPEDFEAVSACSLTSKSAALGTLSDLTIDSATSHKNARITLSISADGTASLSVIRDAKSGETEGINKTYTGTVSENAVIKSFTISNGSGEDGSRAYTIDNLTTTVTSPEAPTPTPEIKEAQKYTGYTNDEKLANKDAVGFVATISGLAENESVNSLTWYLKKADTEYKELTSGAIPTVTGGTAMIGLIVYDLPDGVTAEDISAGYSYTVE
ncbi:MAG: hypothetical protein ACI38A_10990 [Candidatus Ornithomonoglobus sp.]